MSFILLVVLGMALFAVTRVLQASREDASGRSTGAGFVAKPPEAASAVTAPVTATAEPDATGPAAPALGGPASSRDMDISPQARVDDPGARASSGSRAPMAQRPLPPGAERVAVGPQAPSPPQGGPPRDLAQRIAAVSAPYRLVARTSEATWMRVKTEDGHVSEETIPAGGVREWVSNRRFVVAIGNAGGVKLELNGRPLPSLGVRGVVIPRIVLPPEAP